MPQKRHGNGGPKGRRRQRMPRRQTGQDTGGDTSESVGMAGRDDPNRVGGRGRRTRRGEPVDDTAEGGRQPSDAGDMETD